MKLAIRSTPIITKEHLSAIGSLECGISLHRGVIILWDSDYDTRVLDLIDEIIITGPLPLVIKERKGCVSLLWEDAVIRPDGYDVGGDWWCAEHRHMGEVFPKLPARDELKASGAMQIIELKTNQ